MKYKTELNFVAAEEETEISGQIPFFEEETPEGILKWALTYFGIENIALSSSFGAEDQVLTDMLLKIDHRAKIFSLDTGRLHQETYDTIVATTKRYGVNIEMLFPDTQETENMLKEYGPNLFYESLEKRKLCCEIRKINPLRKKLRTLKAWICGLRKEQSKNRSDLKVLEWDEAFSIFKVNPLCGWTDKQVWDYIRENNVPYNPLHDRNYPSIGCCPCSRAVKQGEHIRSGRWWWEDAGKKECGLHLKNGKLCRAS